jgi:hypothetical protein
MNSATLDVNLKCSLTDFRWRWPVLASFFRKVRLKDAGWYVMSIRRQFL